MQFFFFGISVPSSLKGHKKFVVYFLSVRGGGKEEMFPAILRSLCDCCTTSIDSSRPSEGWLIVLEPTRVRRERSVGHKADRNQEDIYSQYKVDVSVNSSDLGSDERKGHRRKR